jgi:hypothetical protein
LRISLRSTWAWLVPVAYLALPNCSYTPPEQAPPCSESGNLQPGCSPRQTVVFCDIEKPLGRHCAKQQDLDMGIPLARAAVAFSEGERSTIGLDYSPPALARCNGGPEAVTFECPFPDGCPVGMNCDQIGEGRKYDNENEVCVDRCADVFGETLSNGLFLPHVPPDPSVRSFCKARARASTNFSAPCADFFYIGACTAEGALLPTFEDPRRHLEPVHWRHKVGVATSGPSANTLTKTAPGTGSFDSGAASLNAITRGDAYVEFTAVSTDTARALGVSVGAASTANPDTDPALAGIGFAIRLSPAGDVFIHEGSDQEIPGGNLNGSFTTYAAGDRIRLVLTDNNTDPPTATISYLVIPAACTGPLCGGTVLRTVGPAPYPFRVDASLRTPGAVLNDVNMVRIKQF